MSTFGIVAIVWCVGVMIYTVIGAAQERERSFDTAMDLASRAFLWPLMIFWRPR